jgi:hypothetical protein
MRRAFEFTRRATKHAMQGHGLADAIRHLRPWWASFAPGCGPFDSELPWISFAAIDRLRSVLRPDMTVFEYGSGGSTLFWARRVAHVHSIEHDPEWFSRVRDAVAVRGLTNVSLELREPSRPEKAIDNDPADPDGYASDDERYRGSSFERYARSIEACPDGSLDVVMIDGRARPSCFKHGHPKVRPGGYLILDNSERSYYHQILDDLHDAGWRRYDFFGPPPALVDFCRTTFFVKPVS